MSSVLAQPRVKRLLSSEHVSVDGTLIEAWASMKSFRPRDGGEPPAPSVGRNSEADFHGQKRSNKTHASTTDPQARLYRKGPGKEAKLCFMGYAPMENRNGLIVDACLTEANGHAERIAALHMIEPRADGPSAITLGADKAYDAEDFVNEPRSMNATLHVAQNTNGRSSAIDGRTTRHVGYALTHPQADRGGLRLDQDHRWPGANQAPRSRARRMGLHRRDPRVKPEGRTWMKTNMTRLRGWAPKGERLVDKVPHGRWKTATFLAALRNDRIDAPGLFDGPLNGERFRAYVEPFLKADPQAGRRRHPRQSRLPQGIRRCDRPSEPSGRASCSCPDTRPTSIRSSRSLRPRSRLCCERPKPEPTTRSPTQAQPFSLNTRPNNAPPKSETHDTRKANRRTL